MVKITAAVFVCGAAAIADQKWEQYKKDFQKTYASDSEESDRYAIFLETVDRIEKLNAKGNSVFGLTWTSDRKPEEKYAKGYKKPADFKPTAPIYEKKQEVRSPAAINWRFTEAITPIKNQGQCGSCWAFSATSAIESALALQGGEEYSIELAPQQITSCTPSSGTYGCDGCNGGFTEGAYEYVKSVAGLANSFYIPYEQSLTASSLTKICPTKKVEALDGPDAALSGGFAAVTGYSYATPACTSGSCADQDLTKLQQALEETPVSICVNAGTWNDYTGGVMTSAQCGSMAADEQDHCVQATGFNTTAPTPYWIVRNSWASGWGEKGYIYLEMAENTCGLADDATIPTVSLNLSPEEELKASASRDHMYSVATMTQKHDITGDSTEQGLCDGAACPAVCACAESSCSSQVNACLGDSTCAAAQDCVLACACGDTACAAACAVSGGSLATDVLGCVTSSCSGDSGVSV